MISELDFWRWAYSDHLSNSQRGVLAEYIVGHALGATNKPRVEWDQYDLKTPEGITIEVKSSAYVQTWEQKKPSDIQFDIAPKLAWNAEQNTIATEKRRSAMVYVFCVLHEQDRTKVNPLDLSHWYFLIASTKQLDEWFGEQKSVRLSMLIQKNCVQVDHAGIRQSVLDPVAPST